MRTRRGILFHLVCALSLILATAVVLLWTESFDGQRQIIGILRGGENHALVSKAGQLVLVGPPMQEVSDPLPRQLIGRMCNSDFEWSKIGSDYVCGAARRDTPTWEVYQHYFMRERRGRGLEPDLRIWIYEAKDDPNRYVPAHMLFMFAAEQKRTKPQVSAQRWKEIGVRTDEDGARIPEVIMAADAQQKGPEFSSRWDLKRDWSDVMETPRGAVFDGWIFLGAMVMPLAWAARPRIRKHTFAKWTFNWVALTLFIVCSAGTVMWVRSFWVDEQFRFAPRAAPLVAGRREKIDSIVAVGSSRGELRMIRQDVMHLQRRPGEPWGYQRQISNWPRNIQGMNITGEKSLKILGVQFYQLPSQVVKMFTTPLLPGGRAGPPPAPIATMELIYGVKALAIRWWAIVLASGMLPAFWAWRALAWWRKIRIADPRKEIKCLVCGYDIRATPQRCPECGEVAKETADDASR